MFVTYANGDKNPRSNNEFEWPLEGVVHLLLIGLKPFFKLGISPIAGASPVDVYCVQVYPHLTGLKNTHLHTHTHTHTHNDVFRCGMINNNNYLKTNIDSMLFSVRLKLWTLSDLRNHAGLVFKTTVG